AIDVRLDLGPELLHGVLDRPAGAVGQAADRRPRHDADAVADLREDVQVLQPALPALDAADDLLHPARPLAARGTLAARLVGEKATNVVQNVDDAGFLVEDGDGAGAQAEAADLA